ncbi:hypothetical protein D2A34_18375 [Clostridium chromiireducens]|uniref:HTH hxlR-type domain-containing protein n=1 Tax=Clostridium chromiireducens TaxID=225345 RepID=A0A399IL25_9CLOT|nr:winged helix-turn-helix transcriptional regulator [Clostridium chromiireducens]RII33690.1 hypothetical protein D2A34_18375 [Clostridium chromiireducens]
MPSRVEYCLTEEGNSVVHILQSICRWSEAYHKEDNENRMTQCEKCDYKQGKGAFSPENKVDSKPKHGGSE